MEGMPSNLQCFFTIFIIFTIIIHNYFSQLLLSQLMEEINLNIIYLISVYQLCWSWNFHVAPYIEIKAQKQECGGRRILNVTIKL